MVNGIRQKSLIPKKSKMLTTTTTTSQEGGEQGQESIDIQRRCLQLLEQINQPLEGLEDPAPLLQELLDLLPPEFEGLLAESSDPAATLLELQQVLEEQMTGSEEESLQVDEGVQEEEHRPRTSPLQTGQLNKKWAPHGSTPDLLKRPETYYSSPWRGTNPTESSPSPRSPFASGNHAASTAFPMKQEQPSPFKFHSGGGKDGFSNSPFAGATPASTAWFKTQDAPSLSFHQPSQAALSFSTTGNNSFPFGNAAHKSGSGNTQDLSMENPMLEMEEQKSASFILENDLSLAREQQPQDSMMDARSTSLVSMTGSSLDVTKENISTQEPQWLAVDQPSFGSNQAGQHSLTKTPKNTSAYSGIKSTSLTPTAGITPQESPGKLQKRIRDLEKTCKVSEERIQSLEKTLETTLKEKETILAEAFDSKSREKSLKSAISAMESTLETMEKQLKAAQEEKVALKTRLDKLKDVDTKFKAQLDWKDSEMTTLNSSVASLEKQVQSLMSSKAELETQIESLKQALDTTEARLELEKLETESLQKRNHDYASQLAMMSEASKKPLATSKVF
jgi:predicted  nucleic acid-binding Zn-ribbon protein